MVVVIPPATRSREHSACAGSFRPIRALQVRPPRCQRLVPIRFSDPASAPEEAEKVQAGEVKCYLSGRQCFHDWERGNGARSQLVTRNRALPSGHQFVDALGRRDALGPQSASKPLPLAQEIQSTFSLETSSTVALAAILSGNSIKLSQFQRADGAIKPSHPRNSTAAPICCVRSGLISEYALSDTPRAAKSARIRRRVRCATTRSRCTMTGLVGLGLSCDQWKAISAIAPSRARLV